MKRSHLLTTLLLAAGSAAQAQMGQPTPVHSNLSQAWLGAESQNRANDIVQAPAAWARGWTGLGSGILIMDTGIDINHIEFQGRIRATLDLSGRGITDRVKHGTHVAGVAAAARDGRGMHGVAFDSHIYVAKLSDNTAISARRAQQALKWAQQFPDIRAANFSANTQFNKTYTRAMRNQGSGVYVSGDRLYSGQNFYNRERPEDWAQVLAPGVVLTVSAGNQNLPYPQNPASFAAAVDAQGRLILRGQMLIVGNWNDRAGRIESARAGHVCRDLRAGQCRDPYRNWDFYILAPGMAVNSTVPGGRTQNMSGSSQAAPVVAGAVAIVGQMWPYMPADQVVQLLLRTARRDLPGYHVTTHGQGLLDLDRATQPVGALGLRTQGRQTGRQPMTGAVAVAGVMTPSSMAVLDEFDRDFQVQLRPQPSRSRWHQAPVAVMQSWIPQAAGVDMTALDRVAFGSQGNSSALSVEHPLAANWSTRTSWARMDSDPTTWVRGVWGHSHNSQALGQDLIWRSGAWQAELGWIRTRADLRPGLVSSMSAVDSIHARMAYDAGWARFETGMLPRAVHGEVRFQVPDHMDAQGQMQYREHVSAVRETAVGYVTVELPVISQDLSAVTVAARADSQDQYQINVQARLAW